MEANATREKNIFLGLAFLVSSSKNQKENLEENISDVLHCLSFQMSIGWSELNRIKTHIRLINYIGFLFSCQDNIIIIDWLSLFFSNMRASET